MTGQPSLTDARLQIDGRIALLTLDRDDVRNELTGTALAEDIVQTVDWLNRNDAISVLVLTGAGKAFSAGGNVKHMRDRKGSFGGDTQLRACGVTRVNGIDCIIITPEADTVNNSRPRTVPLHPHLLEQGLLLFARRKAGTMPLFYSIERQRRADRKNPAYKSVGNKLGCWVRGLGIEDELVWPNHSWPHRFKTVGRKARMDPEVRDAIQGHKPRTEGEDYDEDSADVILHKLLKHPRYDVQAAERRDGRRWSKSKPAARLEVE